MVSRQSYPGTSRKLVVAFDVGTTFSGVSYCLLDPGRVPEIKGVTRYPSQGLTRGDSKIPSIIWYDQSAKPQAIGAEAVCDGIEDKAQDGQWVKVEWFKLHLRPTGLWDEDAVELLKHIPPLPLGLSIITVFADFLRYLLECTRNFIQEGNPAGAQLWESIEPDIEYVISHPNGWKGSQQRRLRQAAIQAGLVPDTDAGEKRIHFVTEGEASLHFCISNGLITDAMKNDGKVVVVDAGGGTVDICCYGRQTNGGKQLYEELASPSCLLEGSVLVTERARGYLNEFLKDSTFAETIPDMCDTFDKMAKLSFRSAQDPVVVRFGNRRDHDVEYNISYGQLKLPGDTVANFFKPAVESIVKAILEHLKYLKANTVFFVGGFAASDWLFHQIQEAVAARGVDICRPDNQANKVVANGGVSFYIDHYVAARISKYSYGIRIHKNYKADKAAHIRRVGTCYTTLSGRVALPGAFSEILHKNSKVTEQEVFRCSYSREVISVHWATPKTKILVYTGSIQDPGWLDEDPDHFKVLCTIEADLTSYASTLEPQTSPAGTKYYTLKYDILLGFGLTELTAQYAWMEKGIERRGPARIVYGDE